MENKDKRKHTAFPYKPGKSIVVAPGIARGPLLPPPNRIMGNESSMKQQSDTSRNRQQQQQQSSRSVPRSNLTALMQQREAQQQQQQASSRAHERDSQDSSDALQREGTESHEQSAAEDTSNNPQHASRLQRQQQEVSLPRRHVEADSASGPAAQHPENTPRTSGGMRGPVAARQQHGHHSAPPPSAADMMNDTACPPIAPEHFLPQSTDSSTTSVASIEASRSTGALLNAAGTTSSEQPMMKPSRRNSTGAPVRRCMSSKELGKLMGTPSLSTSPYAYMLYQRDILEGTMQERLVASRGLRVSSPIDRSFSPSPVVGGGESSEESSVNRKNRLLKNEKRNQRRAEHTRAVVKELCEIVTDLFVAESKLLNPSKYGVDPSLHHREAVSRTVEEFVSALPTRYALSVDTPSEVLLHMRLMAVARSDPTRAAVHTVIQDSNQIERSLPLRPSRSLYLVTISCRDTSGLLEYMTKLLSSGGSRVLDADVMTSTDGIVLDRYVVEMNGRLQLNKLANYIEAFLAQALEKEQAVGEGKPSESSKESSPELSPVAKSESPEIPGPVYFHPPSQKQGVSPLEIQQEMQSAVPLSQVLASDSSTALEKVVPMRSNSSSPRMRRQHSSPPVLQPAHPRSFSSITTSRKSSSQGSEGVLIPSPEDEENIPEEPQTETLSMRQRRPLVNREATNFQDDVIGQHRDFLLVAPPTLEHSPGAFADVEDRQIPLIPFEELMLIETLGMGRVSTIYRAAWKRGAARGEVDTPVSVGMVALKVATVNPDTGDTFHVDELRREADIAALLKHNNICDLVGVAADAECFCIAYEFCEGGSLLSLLSDTSRYYEYLPIALDIANGMAYLHSRNVIHRDLKPSNILLTRDHRAKISDFGMSVANTGQELTAETGTYRYMAPEVIRHEVYSSNADVYSFGIVLWQLITREVPFATMTPIQAAFAVAGGRRPEIPLSTPPRLRALIEACWDQDSHKRPSFAWIGMELADYARMAFSPANVGAQTLNIANEMLANVVGESNVNVDPSVAMGGRSASAGDMFCSPWFGRASSGGESYSYIGGSSVGLEI